MKRIFLYAVLSLIFSVGLSARDYFPHYFFNYVGLFGECLDDQPSQIYDLGTPWLEDPRFPGGGRVQMARYVHFNTRILNVRDADGEQLRGRVLISAVVDRCGELRDIQVINSLSPEHDAEAIRVVESFPVFMPGIIDGIRVKVAIFIPVYFERTYVPGRHQQQQQHHDTWDDWGNDDHVPAPPPPRPSNDDWDDWRNWF